MKISFFTQNIAPFRMKWMDALAQYYDITVYHVNEYVGEVNRNYVSYKTQKANIKDVSKKIGNWSLYDIKKIFRDKHDLIILDGYGFLAQQLLIMYLSFHHIKYIMTIDGGFVNKDENIIKKYFKSFLFSQTEYFLSTSEQTDNFISYYYNGQAKIFRHKFSSLDAKDIILNKSIELQKRCRNELGMKDIYTIIAVGKFIPIKGFDVIIKALTFCQKDVQLYIVGGSNGYIYQQYINPNIKDKIHFVDFCDKDLLKKYYQASDVFVMASRGDVWGLVIGEAMACGLPVITSDKCLAGVALIENNVNGYIFPVDDYKSLAKNIDLLNNIEICQKMGNNNINKIKEYAIEEAVKEDKRNIDWIKENI